MPVILQTFWKQLQICEILNVHFKLQLTNENLYICVIKCSLTKRDFLLILTSLTARPCCPSWASTAPCLMVTGHPSLALTPVSTGSAIGPWEACWELTYTCRHTQFTLMFKAPLLSVSFSCNFLCPIHTHVCHTWLLSSPAHTHSDLSLGGNSNYGHSRTSAHSLLQRIP